MFALPLSTRLLLLPFWNVSIASNGRFRLHDNSFSNLHCSLIKRIVIDEGAGVGVRIVSGKKREYFACLTTRSRGKLRFFLFHRCWRHISPTIERHFAIQLCFLFWQDSFYRNENTRILFSTFELIIFFIDMFLNHTIEPFKVSI